VKRNKIIAVVVGAALLLALLTFTMTYPLRFYEVALVTTFGNPGGEDSVKKEPGLHVKLPAPIQAVKTFDRRLQLVDTRLETQATRDGLQVVVQAFTFWRIDDSPQGVINFNQAFGSIDEAHDQLEARMRSAMGALSEFEFDELMGEGNRLAEAEERIKERLMLAGSVSGESARTLADLGVKIERVGLSQIMLPVETTQSVVTRMTEERQLRANMYMNQGLSKSTTIASEAAGKAERIKRYADRLAAILRARGDELAASSITVMNEDPEFAVFLIWLDGLERTTAGATTFFLPPTIAPFHLLSFDRAGLAGTPKPEGEMPRVVPIGEGASERESQASADNADATEEGN
jgi:membrane protease subunit HflC